MTTQVNFYQRSFEESWTLIQADLTSTGYRLVEILSSSAVFSDGYVCIPPAKELAEHLGRKLSCIYDNLRQIREKCPHFQIICSRSVMLVKRDNPKNQESKNFLPSENLENFPINRNHFQKFVNDSKKSENQQLELLSDKDSDFVQTIHKDHTTQTGGKVDEKVNKEEFPKEIVEEEINKQEEKIVEQQKEKEDKYTVLPNHEPKTKIPPNVTQKKYNIPDELIEKLRMLDIKPSEQVLVKISQHHISQAYGAVAHIENTFETIRDKTAVFLYQLPKQPIEKLGQRHTNESLEKQKQDLKLIEEEIKQGRKSLSDMTGFSRIKQKLANMTEKRPKK